MDMSSRAQRTMLQQAAGEGRATDNFMGHLTKGEIVIPVELQTPELLSELAEVFSESGGDIDEFTVGSQKNKINPKTGQPEFFWTALATLAVGALAVNESRKARRQAQRQADAARKQAAEEAAAVQQQLEAQADAQRQQAEIARQRAEEESARFAAEKAKLEEEAKKRQEELEAAQREMGERESARLRASRRSGRRSLLSQARLSPELGLGGTGTALSPTAQTAQMM